ncbi:MAG: LytTR family transcriptional regulator DNA-binding domain-containing protein [Bacteroidota bacterium]
MKKVIIVDDEAPARLLIREYLADYPDLVVLEECNNGVDAVKAIRTFKPDLLFLDIQMPGLTGFEVLQRLDEMPQIIFSTAYDQYALKAFEVHALDYLLKPYTKARFAQAIKRAVVANTGYLGQLQELAEALHQPDQYPEKIFVQSKQKLVGIQLKAVIWIEADGDYSRLITTNGTYLSNYGISSLEEKLNPKDFVRVHRSAIVNLNHVKEVYKHASSYDLVMINGETVRVSRTYLEHIRKLTF